MCVCVREIEREREREREKEKGLIKRGILPLLSEISGKSEKKRSRNSIKGEMTEKMVSK